MTHDTSPLIETLELNVSCETAFNHFVKNIHEWWPLQSHTLTKDGAKTAAIEPKVGGKIYEIGQDGTRYDWGDILVFEPPHKLSFNWDVPSAKERTKVEIEFKSTGKNRCRLTLTHSGWDQRPGGAEARISYVGGWDGVLGSFTKTLPR